MGRGDAEDEIARDWTRRRFLRSAAATGAMLVATPVMGIYTAIGATIMDLAVGHQVLVRRNPKPSSGYIVDANILLQPADALTLDPTRLRPGHRVVVRRATKPADGWIKDPYQTLTATETLTIPALSPTPPPPVGDLRGFGKGVVMNTGPLVTVSSLTALRAASGKHVKVEVPAGTIWNLQGSNLNLGSGTTIDFGNLTLMGGSVFMAGVSNVFIENLRSHAGDEFGNATDLDPVNLNGNQNPVSNVYFRNCQFLWGPDTCGAFLGDISNVTFERCVFAEGLYNSRHAESPHSLGPNVASEDPSTPAQNISFIECLVSTCQSRNFRLIGVVKVELIGSTIYNYNEGPQGCPTAANLLGCTWKKGPIALKTNLLFRAQDGGHGAFVAKPDTVYEHGGQAIGFTSSGIDAKVRATSPRFTSTEAEPDAAQAAAKVAALAGAIPADKQLSRIRHNVQIGEGAYVNGFGKPNSYTALV